MVLCQSVYTDELMSRAHRIRMTWVSATVRIRNKTEVHMTGQCPWGRRGDTLYHDYHCNLYLGERFSLLSDLTDAPPPLKGWVLPCTMKKISYITVVNKTLMERSFVYFFLLLLYVDESDLKLTFSFPPQHCPLQLLRASEAKGRWMRHLQLLGWFCDSIDMLLRKTSCTMSLHWMVST